MVMSCIQAIYDSQATLPTQEHVYSDWLEDISYFHIGSQVYHLLVQKQKLEQTPLFFQERLREMYNKSLITNTFIRFELKKLMQAFEDAGVSMIPLKGVTLSEKYYGNLGARNTTDIDILIKINDLKRAIRIVQSLGFIIEEKRIPSHFHQSFSKPLPNQSLPLTVELHWDILTEKTSCLNIHTFWQAATPFPGYQSIYELTDYHTFYLICLHGWRHALNSIKYFIDIIQLIQHAKDSFEYEQLLLDAKKDKTFKRMQSTLSIVYEQFPFLQQIKTFSLLTSNKRWWNYEAIREPHYKQLIKYVRFLQYQWMEFDKISHSLHANYQYWQALHERR